MNWSDVESLPPALRDQVQARFQEGNLDEEVAMQMICDELGIPYLNLIPSQVDAATAAKFGLDTCRELGFLPLFRAGSIMVCVMRHPWSGVERAKIQHLHYDELRVLATSDTRFNQAVAHLRELQRLEVSRPKPPFVPPIKVIHGWGKGNDIELAQDLIRNAFYLGASDVHFEPTSDRLVIRYRINGVMVPQNPIEARFMSTVMDRIKGMAGFPTSDKKTLKDGRFSVALSREKSIDLRVAAMPCLGNAEGIVLRILDPDSIRRNTGKLPFPPKQKEAFLKRLNAESGMIIITGPTGSGKTTTLYTSLTSLNLAELKVLTVEDPVEYKLDKISQVQLDPANNVTFANALRAFLRSDPDVIMVGEIRDPETAELATSAANTGHIVLATLHTNNATQAVPRLQELKVSPQGMRGVLKLVVAQRLVPVLCPHCRAEYITPAPIQTIFERYRTLYGLECPTHLAQSYGCHSCLNTGVVSRTPVFQFFDVNDELRSMIGVADERALSEANARYNPNLFASSLFKVAEKVTHYSAAAEYEDI